MLRTIDTMMLIVTAVAILTSCSAFLLAADNCPVPSPCTCSLYASFSDFNCYGKHLKKIPRFDQSNYHVTGSLTVYMSSNSITVIPDNTFSNLASSNVTSISLDISDNNIHTIANNAFNGIENVTYNLYLHKNNLTTLPVVLGKLVHLQSLYVFENPIHSLDVSVMSKIGRSLTRFHFGMRYFTQWPTELQYLTRLQAIAVFYIPFSHIDAHAFRGFENTITNIQIQYSKLERIPYAICNLNNVTAMWFYSNHQLKENGSIFEPCSGKYLLVYNLHLSNNGLHTFPDVFSLFPSLTYLFLDYNQIEFIDSAIIPTNYNLTTISLNYNMFERIPSALNKLKSLENVFIQSNKIKTIESTDLSELSQLTSLKLSNNPIMYISADAFKNNINLDTLFIQNARLQHIPVAVTHLPKLGYLLLDGNHLECTCDMSYLKHWNVTVVRYFNTVCASSSETVKTYVMNSLQACP